MKRTRQLLAPLATDLSVPDAGWASRSLVGSIRRTALVMVAGWQLVMMISAVLSIGLSAWPLLVAYAALAGYALFAQHGSRARPVWFVPVAMAALGVVGYFASGDIGSVLVFAACWQINFATCAAGLLLLSRWVVPAVLVGAVTIGILLFAWLPEWGTHLPGAIPVTQAAIIVALRLGLPSLLSLATRADAEEAAAEQARDRAEVVHRVSAQVAEESRVLHDTVINTLGAIANGGAGTRDANQVREQCGRNVTVLDALRGERVGIPGDEGSLPGLFAHPGIPIRRRGIDDAAFERLARRLPRTTIAGLVRAAREAVVNANKHSGASRIDITVAEDGDGLRVEVRDDGRGFDGSYPAGRGLGSSVFDRGRDLGFDAELTTSPGDGTTITLTATSRSHSSVSPLDAPVHDDVDGIVAGLSRRAGLLWSGGVTAVSVLLTVSGGTNHSLALFPMLAIMGATWVTFGVAPPRALRWWGVLGLTVSTILVFGLSAAATAFGTDGTVHWQALAATGPFTLLLSARPSQRTVLIAGTACTAAVLGIAILTWPHSGTGAAIIIVAGGVAGVFSVVWSRFVRNVAALSAETAAAQRRALLTQRAADADQAAQDTYRRWVGAGLDSGAELLRAIADGELDPQNPVTQSACGIEEAYLRQLVLVSPELVHLGHAMMPTLRYARERGIPLGLRLGAQDAADERSARSLATVVMRALESSAPGHRVIASVFPVHGGLQLTLVGGGGIQQIFFPTSTGSSLRHPETHVVRKEPLHA